MIVRNVADTVLEFAEALNQNSLHLSGLPCFEASSADEMEPNSAPPPAATEAQGPQEAQPQSKVNQPYAQSEGQTPSAWVQEQEALQPEQPQPSLSQLHAYQQHSYHPDPGTSL